MFQIDTSLIQKYSVIGPRYTSYPTAPLWRNLGQLEQVSWITASNDSKRPLSLYFHIPFCPQRCYYCGCNAIVTRQQSASAAYIRYLIKELDALGKRLGSDRFVRQLHFGGGTPNFLLNAEFEAILAAVNSCFSFEPDAEMAIEVAPYSTRPGQLAFLRKLGFNRLSFGVQDFNKKVQQAINRIQSVETTRSFLLEARDLGFKGINFDLIYGLPYQTLDRFRRTLDTVIEMAPDRLAVYNFGYLPDRMPHQRKIKPDTLPDANTKLSLLLESIKRLTDAGYEYIGMDHFAKPDDELAVAMKDRSLHRNFMGYTPKSGIDLFGLGTTAISEFGSCFLQNEKELKSYKARVEDGGLAACRGLDLSRDDRIRKWTILRLICHFYLSFSEFKNCFETAFFDYFHPEGERLKELEMDGLLEIRPDHLQITDPGKILIRNICMVFDAYLKKSDRPPVRYSKTI